MGRAGRLLAALALSAAAGCSAPGGGDGRNLPTIRGGGDRPPTGRLDPEDVLGHYKVSDPAWKGPVTTNRVEVPLLYLPMVVSSSSFSGLVEPEGPSAALGTASPATVTGPGTLQEVAAGDAAGMAAERYAPGGAVAAATPATAGSPDALSGAHGASTPSAIAASDAAGAAVAGERVAAAVSPKILQANLGASALAVEAGGDAPGAVASEEMPYGVSSPDSPAVAAAPDRPGAVAGPDVLGGSAESRRPAGAAATDALAGGAQTVSLSGTLAAIGAGERVSSIQIASAGEEKQLGEARVNPPKATFVQPVRTPAPFAGDALLLEKAADRRQVTAGDPIRFTIRYRNQSPWILRDVVIQDRLSLQLRYTAESASRPGAEFRVLTLPDGNEILEWRLRDPLPPGAGGAFEFEARVR